MATDTKKESGVAYIAILGLVVIVSALGAAFLNRTGIQSSASMQIINAAQAEYLAESAANHAMWKLLHDGGFPADETVYYMHSMSGSRYGYKVRRHTNTTFATIATVGAVGDHVVNQSYVLYVYPPPAGFEGWWLLDETSGYTAADSSGLNNHGTLTNMDPATDWVAGKIGGALAFDGFDDYVNAGNDSSLDMGSGDFTLCAWFNTSSNAADATIVSKGGIASGGKRYLLKINSISTGDVAGEIDDDGAGGKREVTSNPNNYNDSQWHHVALVRDGSNLRLYIDGAEDTNSPTDITGYGNIDSIRNFSIASNYHEGTGQQHDYFNGLIDDVRIYSSALSAAEIAALFVAGGG
jgi:hypothetical protein